MPHIHWIGAYGELVAASWLATKGYHLLKRNYTWMRGKHKGEIDLVMRQGDTLAFVEVKTRTSRDDIAPICAVDAAKCDAMRRGARHWCMQLGRDDIPLRFDIVEVLLRTGQRPELYLHQAVFQKTKGHGRRMNLRGKGLYDDYLKPD